MTLRTWLVSSGVFALVAAGVPVMGAPAAPDSKRMERAKDFIADEQWIAAIDLLKRAVADSREPNRDEALFWLAHSEHQAQDLAAAVETIAQLEREFPRSRWVRPARSLRVEIAQRLKRDDVLWWTVSPPAPPPAPVATAAVPAVPPPAPVPPPRMRKKPTPPAKAVPVAVPAPPAAPSEYAFPPEPPNTPSAWIPAPFAPDTDLQIQALGSLIRTHPAQVIPLLKQIALDSRNAGDARRAVFVLAQSGRPEARTTVIEVAKTGPEPVRVAAVREIGRFGSANASADLLQVYSTATPRVKREVVSSLAALGNRADTAALLKIARTEADAEVRNVAIMTLAQTSLDGRLLRSLYVQAPHDSRRTVLVALCNARNEDELIQIASTEKDPALRREARRQLRLLGSPKALQYLTDHP